MAQGSAQTVPLDNRLIKALPLGKKRPCYRRRMKKNDELKSLSDDELLQRLSALLSQSRRVESDLAAHIGELDARRLYTREACSSMFRSNCTLKP